jgi:predicted transposase YdaD
MDAIPRLLEFGLSVEQVANTLSWSMDEVRSFVQSDQ